MSDEEQKPVYQRVECGDDAVTTIRAPSDGLIITINGVRSLPIGSVINLSVMLGSATLEETVEVEVDIEETGEDAPIEPAPEPPAPTIPRYLGGGRKLNG